MNGNVFAVSLKDTKVMIRQIELCRHLSTRNVGAYRDYERLLLLIVSYALEESDQSILWMLCHDNKNLS